MNLLDSLFIIAGISSRDLAFYKDLSDETLLKPPPVIQFLENPLKVYGFCDTLVVQLNDFEFKKLLNLPWWIKFSETKVSSRITYRDSVVMHIIDILYCHEYLEKRAFSKLKSDFIQKVKKSLIHLWDTVETSDTLSKDEYKLLAEGVNWNSLFNSFSCLLKLDTTKLKPIPDAGIYIYRTAFGDIAIAGKGNNIYEGNYKAIIDFGGDDRYYLDSTVLVVDFSGNDLYYGNIGGGFMGSSVVYDFGGDDFYNCADYSCGSGLLGFGMIFDKSGNDIYSGGIHVMGAGTFGSGFLVDMEGDDVYKGVIYGQGFGGPFGVGLLYDKSGNDLYTIGYGPIHKPLYKSQREGFGQGFGFGIREDLGGGFGILLDFSGNDVYNSGTFAQGASYWYAFGFLYDGDGDDRYVCTQYCQGSGIHLSTALLKDVGGNDMYFSFGGPSIGAGHDLSVGIFYDSTGNDFYRTHSGIGMGWTNSLGIFIDLMGDDTYSVIGCDYSFGGANVEREMGGIGIFLDGEGKDLYNCDVKKGFWVKGQWGFGWDR